MPLSFVWQPDETLSRFIEMVIFSNGPLMQGQRNYPRTEVDDP